MNLPSLKDAPVEGKRVLVRVDYNVPYDENWEVADTSRILESLPTIEYLLSKRAKIILMSHRGRPSAVTPQFLKEKTKLKDALFTHWSEKLLMEYVAKAVERILQRKVISLPDCRGPAVKKAAENLQEGEILLLENLRFYREEEENSPVFAEELASLGELYVNDAFSVSHRAHASIVGIPRFLPSYAGFSFLKEVEVLEKLLQENTHPFLLLVGGAKVSDKIAVVENLAGRVDSICVGGAMSYTFLKAQGKEVGRSKIEEGKIESAKALLEKWAHLFCLPEDVVVADRFSPDAHYKTVPASALPPDWIGMDIGEKTQESFQQKIKESCRLFWNGPMGVFEMAPFSRGTKAICEALKSYQGYAVVGGGESAQIMRQYAPDAPVCVATGGGASLEYLSGKTLPGIQALKK